MAEIYWLEWDDHNEQHIGEHGIVPSEIRQLLGNEHITMSNPVGGADRILLIGRTNGGRYLTISLEASDDPGTWRPVTGWTSTPEERRLLWSKGDKHMDETPKVERHKGREAGVVVSVRLRADEAALLEQLAERDGRTMSETLRIGLRALARERIVGSMPLKSAYRTMGGAGEVLINGSALANTG